MTMTDVLRTATRLSLSRVGKRLDERGEGVISVAIAVLIMAFIGALMWVGFRTIWEDAEDNTSDCVEAIGSDSGDCGAGSAPVGDGG